MEAVKQIQSELRAYKERGLRLFTSSSFQTHSTVLLHIIAQTDPDIPVFFLHTGFHFPETINYKKEITALFGLNTIDLRAATPKIMQVDDHGRFLYTSDPDYCCYLNKIQPLEPMLDTYDIWINGVRADQNANRATFKREAPTAHKAV